MIDWNN